MTPEAETTKADSIPRNAAFALGAQLTTSVFTAALTLYLVRALGPAGYGTFALALGLSALLLLPADFGISASAGRFVAERLGDNAEVRAIVGMAAYLKLLVAGGIAVVLLLLAGPISDAYGSPELAWPLRGVGLALFGQSMMQLSQSVLMATRRFSRIFTLVASESAMEFSASLALVLLGAGVSGAAFGRAIGYVFGAALGLFLISRIGGRSIWRSRGESPVPGRDFAAYSGALLIIDGAFALFSQIDVLIIGALLGSTQVGLFSAPFRFLVFLGYPGLAVAQAVAPRLAGRERPEPVEVLRLQAALRLMVLLQLPIAVYVLIWAEPIVELLLGAGYEESVSVFRVGAAFIFLLGLGPLVSLALNYSGHARERVPIAIASVAVNAGINLALVPRIGIVAGAIGTASGYAIYVGWHLGICRKAFGLPLRPLALTLMRTTLAATPAAALLFLFQLQGLSTLEWVIGLLVGPALVVGGLLTLREVRYEELARVLAWSRRSAPSS